VAASIGRKSEISQQPARMHPTCRSTTRVSPFLCDEKSGQACSARGDDPDDLPHMYARAVNAAIAGPAGGDGRSSCTPAAATGKAPGLAEGGYDPVARAVFSETTWTPGSSSTTASAPAASSRWFRPPREKVVLGLVSTKRPCWKKKDELKRRIDQAAGYVPLENLCVSPQCGFASSHHGNLLTEEPISGESSSLSWKWPARCGAPERRYSAAHA